MSYQQCLICGKQGDRPAMMPYCDRQDCPGERFARFFALKAQRDAERGRPLTDRERLANLRRAIFEEDAP